MRRDFVILLDAGIDPHMQGFGRRRKVDQATDRRQEALVRIFGVDARLQRMAANDQLFLLQRQRLASADFQLPLDQVEAGDHFGDRVLDLQARVHFHEVERAVVRISLRNDELDSACADVADRPGRVDRGLAHGGAARGRHVGRGGFFQHFLVATLHGAIALEQIDAVAMTVAKDLKFDMPRALQILLDQDMLVAETGGGLALAGGQRIEEVCASVDGAHALAAATGGRLDQHRITDAIGLLPQKLRILVVAVIAGSQGHTGFLHQLLGFGLGAHGAQRIHRRADENDAVLRAGLGEVLVLGEEAVARMDGLGAGRQGRSDDLVHHQIGFPGWRRADAHRLVGQSHMASAGIGLGIHGDGTNAHAPRGLDDSASYLAAIGNQYLLEHGVSPGRSSWVCVSPETRSCLRVPPGWHAFG